MPECNHTSMGHAHCTSGAPTCSEIPHSLAWSRKAPSIHDVPRGGIVQVLTNRDVKPSGRVLRLCLAVCLREARWWLQLEVRKTSICTIPQHYILLVLCFHTTPQSVDPTLPLIHCKSHSCRSCQWISVARQPSFPTIQTFELVYISVIFCRHLCKLR